MLTSRRADGRYAPQLIESGSCVFACTERFTLQVENKRLEEELRQARQTVTEATQHLTSKSQENKKLQEQVDVLHKEVQEQKRESRSLSKFVHVHEDTYEAEIEKVYIYVVLYVSMRRGDTF